MFRDSSRKQVNTNYSMLQIGIDHTLYLQIMNVYDMGSSGPCRTAMLHNLLFGISRNFVKIHFKCLDQWIDPILLSLFTIIQYLLFSMAPLILLFYIFHNVTFIIYQRLRRVVAALKSTLHIEHSIRGLHRNVAILLNMQSRRREATVTPRDVAQPLLFNNTSHFFLVHPVYHTKLKNELRLSHPSGMSDFSQKRVRFARNEINVGL